MEDKEFNKIGTGAYASISMINLERRDRLRKIAEETTDLMKDPYFYRNHMGIYECKLCLTIHNNEGSYLAHTQSKKHQTNLNKRKVIEAKHNLFIQELKEEQKLYTLEEAKNKGIEELQNELDNEIEDKNSIVNKNINTYERRRWSRYFCYV